MKLDIKEYETKMKKSLDAYENDLKSIRAGRANPSVLDKITVDYYGSPTQIAQVAQVSVPDARTILITPWDKTTLKSIDKAIQVSDLGINPQNDGTCIRLTFPPLTEERRKDLSKEVSKKGEGAKVALRNIRRDANDACKAAKKAGTMTEDEQKTSEKEVQDLTDKYTKMLDKITEAKSKEIMAL
ncbi:MAG: ribosome recycling factor [Clostridia bacterium]|nr:ribosome recycling factor [Clostridia bacterium]